MIEAFSLARFLAVENPDDFGYPVIHPDCISIDTVSARTKKLLGLSVDGITEQLSLLEAVRSTEYVSEGREISERLPLTDPAVLKVIGTGLLRFKDGRDSFATVMSLGPEI